jgi:uncharacterized protein (TIGR00645 family)
MKRTEQPIETAIFQSRWLLAPFYLGLVASLGLLLVQFWKEFYHLLPSVLTFNSEQTILGILGLIDLSLVGNLLLMVIFSGYENFVSKIDVKKHKDKPYWMGTIDFSGLKLKLMSSIVAISAIQLLRCFLEIHELTTEKLFWRIVLHLTFVLSGLLLALMDFIASRSLVHKKS